MTKPNTIVLLSGGMNSAILLYDLVAFEKVKIVECMIFDHYHLNAEEVEYAVDTCRRLDLQYSMWSFEPKPLMDVILEDRTVRVMSDLDEMTKDSFLFSHMLNHATHRAKEINADQVMTGLIDAESPFSWEELDAFCMASVNLASAVGVTHKFPLFRETKAGLFTIVEQLNRGVEVLRDTMSCLEGNTTLRHQWGFGCGSCEGCVRRWRGWEKYLHLKEQE